MPCSTEVDAQGHHEAHQTLRYFGTYLLGLLLMNCWMLLLPLLDYSSSPSSCAPDSLIGTTVNGARIAAS